MPRLAAAAAAAALRALRRADGLAGAAVLGVRGPPARLRAGASGGGLRRDRPRARRRLEGARVRRLARHAAALVAETLEPPGAPLVFVPPDPERRLGRIEQPAEALARELGRLWELPVLPLLERRARPRQRGLSREERRRNVRGAFSARRAPARVVLVDDVYTSGATANAAASALRKAGARQVEVVTFARAVRGYTVRSTSSLAQGGRVATSGEGQESRRQ